MKVLAAQELYMHGTTSKFVPTILSQGMVPKPKNKSDNMWATPYDGSYWAKKLVDAREYAENASEKFGGEPAYVFATIETQDPDVIIDEDELGDWLRADSVDAVIQRLQRSLPYIPRKRWEARRKDIQEYIDKLGKKKLQDYTPEDNAIRSQIINRFKDLVHLSTNVRVKDKAVGYKGATKIVFIAKIVDGKIVPLYGKSDDAMQILRSRYKAA